MSWHSQEEEDAEEEDDSEGEGLAVHVVSHLLLLAPSTFPTATATAEAHTTDTETEAQESSYDGHHNDTNPPHTKLRRGGDERKQGWNQQLTNMCRISSAQELSVRTPSVKYIHTHTLTQTHDARTHHTHTDARTHTPL